MTEDWEALYREFIVETLGDGQISYIYNEYCDGAWAFMEFLKNRSLGEKVKTSE